MISGQDSLRDYQFAKHHIHHYFCTTCGVRSFSRGTGKSGEETVALNLRCISGLEATKLPVHEFDCAKL